MALSFPFPLLCFFPLFLLVPPPFLCCWRVRDFLFHFTQQLTARLLKATATYLVELLDLLSLSDENSPNNRKAGLDPPLFPHRTNFFLAGSRRQPFSPIGLGFTLFTVTHPVLKSSFAGRLFVGFASTPGIPFLLCNNALLPSLSSLQTNDELHPSFVDIVQKIYFGRSRRTTFLYAHFPQAGVFFFFGFASL